MNPVNAVNTTNLQPQGRCKRHKRPAPMPHKKSTMLLKKGQKCQYKWLYAHTQTEAKLHEALVTLP